MKNVLIVEDDAVFLNFIKDALKSHLKNCRILTAENGKIAKDIFQNESIDLLLTDIMMPEMDGLALLAFVNDRKYAIPCFAMSAFGTPEIKKLIPKDVLHFFSKPFSVDTMGPALVNALEEGVTKGVISGITVASFLLLIEMEKKTCLFEIELNEGKKGICYFNKGVLFNAAFEGLKGEDAVLSLLAHEKARFRFKPLPDKKIGKLIEKDLSSLIAESRREEPEDCLSPESFLEENTVKVEYDDAFLKVEDFEDGESKKKQDKEHRLSLDGTYKDTENQLGGRMTVVDMSTTHIIFESPGRIELARGSRLRLDFVLDDKPKSRVNKEVNVEKIEAPFVRCEFTTSQHYDRLGPYLHFNFLDKRTI